MGRAARLLRKGKRGLAADTQPILERINLTPGDMAGTLSDWFCLLYTSDAADE